MNLSSCKGFFLNKIKLYLETSYYGTDNKRLLPFLKGDYPRTELSKTRHIENLKMELYYFTKDKNFKTCANMGYILEVAFDFVVRNYESVNTYIIR